MAVIQLRFKLKADTKKRIFYFENDRALKVGPSKIKLDRVGQELFPAKTAKFFERKRVTSTDTQGMGVGRGTFLSSLGGDSLGVLWFDALFVWGFSQGHKK
ncbi:MAG: hypothetical protein FWC56_05420 [Phycisphaerae bacterium]|nr:hypothetical protein [Phycisphaerae bacterium]